MRDDTRRHLENLQRFAKIERNLAYLNGQMVLVVAMLAVILANAIYRMS